MTDVLCAVGVVLLFLALIGLGSFIVALMGAQPADECTYCDECFEPTQVRTGKSISFVRDVLSTRRTIKRKIVKNN